MQEDPNTLARGSLYNFLYYTLRLCLDSITLEENLAAREQQVGVTRVSDPHCLDVEAQIIEMNK
ncbi:MAG: hypothetical protein KDE58_01145, partial [Caldilineaceae bacterium]|nr:hypothetical protein [Caldilineaceae bacterium]